MIEILIALAILGIVVMIAMDSFRGMGEKYRVEGETKQLYADLMDARGRAMQRNRAFFIRVTTTGYRTYEDSDPVPDGDNNLNEAADTLVANVTVHHAIATAGGVDNVTFNRNGTASAAGHVRLSSTAKADYDCVGIGTTRLNMGQYNSVTGNCVER